MCLPILLQTFIYYAQQTPIISSPQRLEYKKCAYLNDVDSSVSNFENCAFTALFTSL